MAIIVKNDNQIEKMRVSGKLVGQLLLLLEKAVRPGVTTKELDDIAYDFIIKNDATPSFKNYNGFPASICASINDEVIHGIPGLRKLKSGDIISIDVGVFKNGYHGDAARTFPVGDISDEAKKLIDITKQSFFEGLKFVRAGNHLHEISAAIQDYVEANGFSIVRDFVGHGIGTKLHEAPQVPNYKTKSRGPLLVKGMALAIEPMVNVGDYRVNILDDGWTVLTADNKYSAHYEHTVIVTEDEPELLTVG